MEFVISCPHHKRPNGRRVYSIPQSAAPHATPGQPLVCGFTFRYVCARLYLSAVSFGQRFLLGRGLFGWLPELLFQIHAKLYERDAFTFEKFSLKQSVRAANQDFAAVADHAVPRNAFSGRSGGHGTSGRARAAGQTKSFSKPPIG